MSLGNTDKQKDVVVLRIVMYGKVYAYVIMET